MASITKPVLLAVIGILAVVLFLQTSNLVTGMAAGETEDVTTLLGGGNVAPWADTLNVAQDHTALTACGDSTTAISVTAILHDLNGYGNISSYSAVIYNANTTTAACTPANGRNCYTSVSCTPSGGTETYETITCNMGKLKNYAENGTWAINVTVSDGEFTTSNTSYTASGTTKVFTVAVLKALDAEDTINFGTVTPGSSSLAIENDVANCGNWMMDTDVNATDMTCTVGTLPKANIQAGVTSGTWDFALGTGWNTLETNTEPGSDGTVKPFNTTYWNATVPTNGVSGSCVGNVTFKAVENS